MNSLDFALVIPLANEAPGFVVFTDRIKQTLNQLGSGTVYLIVDMASRDNTLELCRKLSTQDPRFHMVYEPENKNVVDAYLKGFKVAYEKTHPFIIEMDGGLSHDPAAIPAFLKSLQEGNECVFGSRYVKGGSVLSSSLKRKFLSRTGTLLSNLLLGSTMQDMTSGFQGFQRHIVKEILDYGLLSKAHFYQTEVRYLLRKKRYVEIPIQYSTTAPGVSLAAITDSIKVLFYYFAKRISFNSGTIR